MYHRETVLEYEDGRVAYWSWGVPANDSDILGFVSRKDLLPVINYKPRSVLFGFNGGTGVMELDEMQFNELLRMFNKGNTKR